MNIADRNKALELISRRQNDEDNGRGCAPAKVKIGTKWNDNGIIDHEALIITDAPAAILNELKNAGYSLSVNEYAGGVSVDKF